MLVNWWKNGLQLSTDVRGHTDGLLIAALYSLLRFFTWHLSVDQFHLGAGVRVAALLLCPPRLWPYLLIGEYTYVAYLRHQMIETHGLAWVVLGSAFQMPAAMLIVGLHRRMMARATDIWILSVAATTAVTVALLNVCMSELLWPVPPSIPFVSRAVRYAFGDFIGILTVAPVALLSMQRCTWIELRSRLGAQTSGCILLMLLIGFCSTQMSTQAVTAKMTLQLLMVLPAVMLTRLHGWWGSTVSLPLLSLPIGLSITSTGLPSAFDPSVYETQQFFAAISVSLVALGSTISHYCDRSAKREYERRHAVTMARASQVTGELHLRQRAIDINRIGDSMDAYLSETADWLKQQGHSENANSLIRTASLYSRKFREQTSMVYPTALEHVGLFVALQAGGVNEAWSSTGRLDPPRLTGDPCRLPVELQLATYRTLTEAVYLLLQNESSQLRINARCGRIGNREGILVVVNLQERKKRLSAETCTLAVNRLTGRALSYGGTVQCRRNRIRMLFLNMAEPERATPQAP